MLGIIGNDKICQVVVKARQFDVKEADSDPASGSNPSDDGMTDVLEDKKSDPVRRELLAFINTMNIDEQCALVALAWIGRGTYEKDEWKDAMRQARQEHNDRTANYLLSLPLLGDYLEEGMSAFGLNCETEIGEL